MDVYENPELLGLYRAYTAGQHTVAAHFNATAAAASMAFPLVIGTATDLALFPGEGAPPVVERLRTTTRGFKEPQITRVADFIADILDANGDAAVVEKTRGRVVELCRAFPVYGA